MEYFLRLILNYDFQIIIGLTFLLFFSVFLLKKVSDKEKNMDNKNIIDLEAISQKIEREYKPINIELTSYEAEQEANAIISYDELISNKKNNDSVNKDESGEISLNYMNKRSQIGQQEYKPVPKVDSETMKYEREEYFLKSLRKLQNDLVR